MPPRPLLTRTSVGNAADFPDADPAPPPGSCYGPSVPQASQHGVRRRQVGETEHGHPRQFGENECGFP